MLSASDRMKHSVKSTASSAEKVEGQMKKGINNIEAIMVLIVLFISKKIKISGTCIGILFS